MFDRQDRITVNPKQCGGRPCLRSLRIRVSDVLDLLAAGLGEDKILEELPDLEPDDIKAAVTYAAREIDHPVLVAAWFGSTRIFPRASPKWKKLAAHLPDALRLLQTGEEIVEIRWPSPAPTAKRWRWGDKSWIRPKSG